MSSVNQQKTGCPFTEGLRLSDVSERARMLRQRSGKQSPGNQNNYSAVSSTVQESDVNVAVGDFANVLARVIEAMDDDSGFCKVRCCNTIESDSPSESTYLGKMSR